MVNWIDSSMAFRGIVSIIYKSLVVRQYSNIPTEGFWERELSDNTVIDWDNVWGNCFVTSKNPAHQMIHYKLIYKAYATPCLLYKMKRKSDPFCHLCNSSSQGTYKHMFWDCPRIALLWLLVRIFWWLRSKRTHCFFFCWMIRHCRCLSIKKDSVCCSYGCQKGYFKIVVESIY